MSYLSDFLGGGNGAIATLPGNGAMKSSIILFDFNPGTRSITLPPGKYRVAVVGGGGSAGTFNGGGYSEYVLTVATSAAYSYTVGSSGGTSSFNSVITATGATNTTPGAGSGGLINTSGGVGTVSGAGQAGGASGHRFGNGGNGYVSGGGWSQGGSYGAPGAGGVDGFGLGIIPDSGNVPPCLTNNAGTAIIMGGRGGYGGGGSGYSGISGGGNGGIGGGGGQGGNGGIGGGGNGTFGGGPGCVIVEVL